MYRVYLGGCSIPGWCIPGVYQEGYYPTTRVYQGGGYYPTTGYTSGCVMPTMVPLRVCNAHHVPLRVGIPASVPQGWVSPLVYLRVWHVHQVPLRVWYVHQVPLRVVGVLPWSSGWWVYYRGPQGGVCAQLYLRLWENVPSCTSVFGRIRPVSHLGNRENMPVSHLGNRRICPFPYI